MSVHASDSQILGCQQLCDTTCRDWPRVRKRIQLLFMTDCLREGDCLPRVKNIIKKVGTTSAIAAFYGPVILYVYAYVIIDGVLSNTDNSFAK